MKRLNIKLILTLLVMISFFVVLSNVSYAGVSMSVPAAAEVGKPFTVTINIPQEAVGYNGYVKVGDDKREVQVFPDINSYSWPGNISQSFTVNSTGDVKVSYSLSVSTADAEEIGGSDEKTINIQNPAPPEIKLSSISITKGPNKTTYTEGESFDKAGMVVKAKYTDNSEKDVTSGVTIEPSGALSPNNKSVTIKYSEGGVNTTASQAITVNAKPQQNTTNTTNTTVVNPTFKDVNENVYAIKNCNVRSSCSTSANNKIGSLSEGELVVRTGYSSEWSRIKYNGQVAYVATNLLTTEEPEDDTDEVNNVVNEIENNTVDDELTGLKNEIGVLPEVGNPVAVKMFFIVSAISIACVSGLLYFKKNG